MGDYGLGDSSLDATIERIDNRRNIALQVPMFGSIVRMMAPVEKIEAR